jgi:phenylacetate-coenzyme A ligase PaaK-like adenylate-forming protein
MPGELPNITSEWIDKIFGVKAIDFEALSLSLFQYQYRHNPIYGQYADAVGRSPDQVRQAADIPFLPISFFKTHAVVTGAFEPAAVFESSGTTQTINSRHAIKDLSIYTRSFLQAFERFYGPPADWCILGLLPSYLERKGSSLVLMVDELVRQSGHPQSGFYLYEHEKLAQVLQELEKQQQKTLLIGVTFALLDFAEQYSLQLAHTTIMETGGMKGRREEWTRQQVHAFLQERLGVPAIHSEYGMTELLSQAYSYGVGIFNCSPWMKVVLREEDDPLQLAHAAPVSGLINVIDLANVYSCAFIATDDVGKLYPDGSFEVMGRRDNADLRGCSLMVV